MQPEGMFFVVVLRQKKKNYLRIQSYRKWKMCLRNRACYAVAPAVSSDFFLHANQLARLQ